MSRLAPLRAVHAWLFDPVPVHPLVAVRVIFGFVMLSCYLVRLPDLEALYGPTGLTGPLLFPAASSLPGGQGWLASQLTSVAVSAGAIQVLYALLLLASLCMMLGLRTRTAILTVLVLHVFFLRARNPFAYWGWANHIQPLLVYLMFSPAGRYLSLDAWLARRRGRGAEPWVCTAWPLRLLQVHTCAMYAIAGWARVEDLGWLRGHAVFNAMTNSMFSRWLIDWQPFKPVLSAMTWISYVLEPLAPIALWIPRLRVVWVYLLFAVHVGLEVLTNVGWWNLVMIASLTCFLPTAHLEAVFRRLPGGPPPARDTAVRE